MDNYTIGYWANTKRWTKTHINKDGKPVCGSQIKEDLSFAWCSHGIIPFDIIECKHCKKWWIRYRTKQLENSSGSYQ